MAAVEAKSNRAARDAVVHFRVAWSSPLHCMWLAAVSSLSGTARAVGDAIDRDFL